MPNPVKLPVYTHRRKILSALKKTKALVIESPTGSGKTTQLPIILHKAKYTKKGLIGITQPRRIAVLNVHHYIRESIDERDKDIVGYKMRFEDATTPLTRLKIMTDGILLQEIKSDPYLLQYKTIIIDEAHERSITIDFILGLLKRALAIRSDLKVIISSATINTQTFSKYFDNCPIISVPAKTYPVKMVFRKEHLQEDILTEEIVSTVKKLVKDPAHQNILVFLPGEAAIKQCQAAIVKEVWSKKTMVCVLYSRISSRMQERVLEPVQKGYKKVVIATNIAETSITIDGITAVIDSGLAKINSYNPIKHSSTLELTRISRSSAIQRMGRAGRTSPGVCMFLYTEEDFFRRPLHTLEEILRTDLSEVVLRMAFLGIRDFETFPLLLPPKLTDVRSAIENLIAMHALSANHSLTQIGKLMLQYPVSPKHSRILIEAINKFPAALDSILTIISFLTNTGPFLLPFGEEMNARKAHMKYAHPYGDFHACIRLFHEYSHAQDQSEFCKKFYLDEQVMQEIANVRTQLLEITEDLGVFISTSKASYEEVMLCLCAGLSRTICTRKEKKYHSKTSRNILIHPGSLLEDKTSQWIIASEIVTTTRTFARNVGVLTDSVMQMHDPEWFKSEKKQYTANKLGTPQKRKKLRSTSTSSNRKKQSTATTSKQSRSTKKRKS